MLDAPCTALDVNLYNVGSACVSYLGVPFALNNFRLYLDGNNYHSMLGEGISQPPLSKCWNQEDLLFGQFMVQDDYRIRSLCATGNISNNGKNPYQILIQKQKENAVYKYEHLPLLWCVLNNNTSYITAEDRQAILDLLAQAPEFGPYNFGPADNGGEWSSPSRLVEPESNRDETRGEFVGLDYMLLHNLYWLTNTSAIPTNINPLVLNPALHMNPGTYTVAATNDIVT